MWTDAKEEILMDAVSVCKDLKEANDRLWFAVKFLAAMYAVSIIFFAVLIECLI